MTDRQFNKIVFLEYMLPEMGEDPRSGGLVVSDVAFAAVTDPGSAGALHRLYADLDFNRRHTEMVIVLISFLIMQILYFFIRGQYLRKLKQPLI